MKFLLWSGTPFLFCCSVVLLIAAGAWWLYCRRLLRQAKGQRMHGYVETEMETVRLLREFHAIGTGHQQALDGLQQSQVGLHQALEHVLLHLHQLPRARITVNGPLGPCEGGEA